MAEIRIVAVSESGPPIPTKHSVRVIRESVGGSGEVPKLVISIGRDEIIVWPADPDNVAQLGRDIVDASVDIRRELRSRPEPVPEEVWADICRGLKTARGLPSATENPDGFHRRYDVAKADGSPVDEDAVYLVLRLDSGSDDDLWTSLCREAGRYLSQRLIQVGHLKVMAAELYHLCSDLEPVKGSEVKR